MDLNDLELHNFIEALMRSIDELRNCLKVTEPTLFIEPPATLVVFTHRVPATNCHLLDL